MDYFTLFGLPVQFALDITTLTTRYQELQRQYHPDKFANGASSEQLRAVAQSATINQAWQTLRNPLLRAEYILSLNGFDIASEQQTVRDSEFLMEQLELHEELEEIERASDTEGLDNFIEHVATMTRVRFEQMTGELDAGYFERAADTVRKLRFLDKLSCQADLLEEKLLDR